MRCEGAQRARTHGNRIGVDDYLDFRAGPTLDTLTQLLSTDDKRNQGAYYKRIRWLMRPDGITVFDNVIRDGLVLQLADDDPDTDVIRARNQRLRDTPRVTSSIIPVGDGITLARKR